MKYQTVPIGLVAKTNPSTEAIVAGVLGVVVLGGAAWWLLSPGTTGPTAESSPVKAPQKTTSPTWYHPGQLVQVESKGMWYAAEILPCSTCADYRVHYIGWDHKWDEEVPAKRIRKHPG